MVEVESFPVSHGVAAFTGVAEAAFVFVVFCMTPMAGGRRCVLIEHAGVTLPAFHPSMRILEGIGRIAVMVEE